MKVQIIAKNMPVRATEGSSGYDLCATDRYSLFPGDYIKINTGVFISMPVGYEAQVRPRSGLAAKGIVGVLGTIDSDYTGEIVVILYNHSGWAFHIQRDERIAQLVFQKVEHPEFEVVTDLPATDRGAGGFGSTGR